LHAAIGSLPEKRREVFELCYLQEMSYREVATALDISIKTVENHMSLALKDLREKLKSWV
jgi:RNA polymerase sigma-70 factor (ECF subfamily)